jgi:hypothetical protein
MPDEKRKGDAGETVRDGVRSLVGILGALKDAIEQSFEDLRDSAERTPERARATAKATAQHARETVEDVRERFDFVARKDLEGLRDRLDQLAARVAALETAAGIEPAPPREPTAPAPAAGEPEPPEERPFRIDSE